MPAEASRGCLLGQTLAQFSEDDCPHLAAALAFYAVFCLPAVVLLATLMAGVFVDAAEVRGAVAERLGGLIGPGGAGEVATMLREAEAAGPRGGLAAVLSAVALLFGATGAFAQLQVALNTAWGVRPRRKGMRHFLLKRLLSFAMLLMIGLLLLVSLVVSAFVARMAATAAGWLPEPTMRYVLPAAGFLLSLLLALFLFAAILKTIPDAEVAWGDVWMGAGLTAVLFSLGQFLLGFYLGRSQHVSAYGAAGALALLLLWVYYSACIVLFGAEFTRVWARRAGRTVVPSTGAVRVQPGPDAPAGDRG